MKLDQVGDHELHPPTRSRKLVTALVTAGGLFAFFDYCSTFLNWSPTIKSGAERIFEVISLVLVVILGGICLGWIVLGKKRGVFRPWQPKYEFSDENITLIVGATNTLEKTVMYSIWAFLLLLVTIVVLATGLWRSRVLVSALSGGVVIGWIWILYRHFRTFGLLNESLKSIELAIRTHSLEEPFQQVNGSPPYSENSPAIIPKDDIGTKEYLAEGRPCHLWRDPQRGEIVLMVPL